MDELGDPPTPEIEPAEPPPGGVDAVEESLYEPQPLVPDLSQLGNEGGRGEVPDELTEPEETSTRATREDGDEEPDPDQDSEESPA
ncbi:MAG: hypothetical protein QM747_10410 [Nocardioides sp.]